MTTCFGAFILDLDGNARGPLLRNARRFSEGVKDEPDKRASCVPGMLNTLALSGRHRCRDDGRYPRMLPPVLNRLRARPMALRHHRGAPLGKEVSLQIKRR